MFDWQIAKNIINMRSPVFPPSLTLPRNLFSSAYFFLAAHNVANLQSEYEVNKLRIIVESNRHSAAHIALARHKKHYSLVPPPQIHSIDKHSPRMECIRIVAIFCTN